MIRMDEETGSMNTHIEQRELRERDGANRAEGFKTNR